MLKILNPGDGLTFQSHWTRADTGWISTMMHKPRRDMQKHYTIDVFMDSK
jgi:hypothetical protein